MPDSVDVIVPMHGRPDLLAACLGSFGRDLPARCTVYVVDDASLPADAELGARISSRQPFRVEWVRLAEHVGFVGAANAGWALSTAPVVLILNNDTVLQRRAIRTLVEALVADPELGAVAATSDNPRDLFQYRCRSTTVGVGFVSADYLTAMCLALRRSAVGGMLFDAAYSPGYFEDLDLCCRLRTSGWRLAIAERARVSHFGGATFTARSDWQSAFSRNYARFSAKWGWLPTHCALQNALEFAGSREAMQ